mmetsp:Transcript_22876/g.54437  ORF Transcript_22876/g.54437 Transcript_22876/m.54437 type:complete len:204 (-) Transcript_22876:264-875(-)
MPCTISLTWLTKTITFSFSTSVASVKLRMLQKPNTASTSWPGTIAFSSAVAPPCMLWTMISAPASPKPSASRPPSLIRVLSKIAVSRVSKSLVSFFFRQHPCLLASSASSSSCILKSMSPSFIACRGFFLMASSFTRIRSSGPKSSAWASRAKEIAPAAKARQIKQVCSMFKPAALCVTGRVSKANSKSTLPPSSPVFAMGVL